jgi:D-amino-acid oxidase
MEIFDKAVGDPWWIDAVRSFRHAEASELPKNYIDGYIIEVPLIEAPIYMNFLMTEFQRQGGKLQATETKISSLNSLYSETDLLINCSGIGAKQLCNDKNVYPIRGQVVRVSNPNIKRSILDINGPLSLSYVFARKNDCILGGTAEENNWELEYDPKTAETIVNNCKQICGSLENAKILEHIVGLRPGRKEIRLESEKSEK